MARETERLQNARDEAETHAMRLRESEAAREQLMESMIQIRDQLSMANDSTEKTDRTREEMEARAAELQKILTEARNITAERAEETLRLTLEVNDLKHELDTLQRDRDRYEKRSGWPRSRNAAAGSWPKWTPRRRLTWRRRLPP